MSNVQFFGFAFLSSVGELNTDWVTHRNKKASKDIKDFKSKSGDDLAL